MMAKYKPPTISQLCERIEKTVEIWIDHKHNGCSDPAYPDGLNMNLLRNHVFSYKRQIKEICENSSLELPEEYYIPNLPYVDNNYIAKPNSERAKRLMKNPSWRCFNHEKPSNMEYDKNQITLF